MNPLKFIKEKPLISALIGVFGLGILFLLFAGRGGAEPVSVTGKTQAEIEADTALGLAQIQSQAAKDLAALELAKSEREFQFQLLALNSQREFETATLQSQERIALSEHLAQTKLGEAQIAAGLSEAQIAAKAQVDAAAASKPKCKSSFFGLFKTCK